MGNAVVASGQMEEAVGGVTAALEAAAPGLAILGGAMVAVGGKALSLSKNLAITAARASELQLVMGIVGSNAGYTAEALAETEEAVKDLGITTAGARTFIIRLLQAQIDLSQATDLARAAQDLAVVAGEDSTATAMRLARAIATGNTFLLKAVGIMGTQRETQKAYAKELGIVDEKTGKMTRTLTAAEKRQSIYNLIMKQAAGFSGVYAKAMENAGKQMRSLSRHISKATLLLGRHLQPAYSAIIAVVTKAIKWFNELSPAIHRFIAVSLAAAGAIGTVGGAMLLKIAIMARYGDTIKKVVKSLLFLVRTAGLLSIPMLALAGAIALVVKVVRDNWDQVGPPIVAALEEMKKAMQPLIVVWKNWGQVIVRQIGQVVFLIVQKLTPVVVAVAKAITGFLQNVGPLVLKVGQYFTYFFRVVSTVLSGIVELLKGNTKFAATLFADAWKTALGVVITLWKNIVSTAATWGKNLIASFSSGIVQGIRDYLVKAIQAVANYIRALMAPGSAPAFLPDLGTWGAEAMQSYIEGFAAADFGLLTQFTDRFKEALVDLVDIGELAPKDFADAFFELRTTMAGLIEEFRETGKISSEALDKIRTRLGKTGEALANVVEWQLRLKAAIEEVEEARKREEEATGAAAALFAVGDIGVEQYEDMVIAAQLRRKEEEALAREKVDEAQEELGKAEALLSLHKETQDVLAQQADMMEAIKDALESVASAVGKIDEDLVPEIEPIVPEDIIPDDLGKEISEHLEDLFEERLDLGKLLPDVEKTKKQVGEWFSKAFVGLKKKVGPILAKVMPKLDKIFKGLRKTWIRLAKTGKRLWKILGKAWKTIQKTAKAVWPNIERIIGSVITFVGDIIETFTTDILPHLVKILERVVGWIDRNWPRIEGVVVPIFEKISEVIANVIQWVEFYLLGAFQKVGDWLTMNWPTIAEVITGVFDTVLSAIEELIPWLETNIPIALQIASDFWTNTLKPALSAVWKFITESVIPVLSSVVTWLETNIPVAIEIARQFWEETLKPALEDVWKFITESLLPTLGDVIDWLEKNIPVAVETAAKFWKEILKPALEEIWKFINENLTPILVALAVVIFTQVVPAFVAYAGAAVASAIATAGSGAAAAKASVKLGLLGVAVFALTKLYTDNQKELDIIFYQLKVMLVVALHRASTAATQLWDIIKFKLFEALNDASTAATQLWDVLTLSLFQALNDAATAASQLWDIIKFSLFEALNDAATAASQLWDILKFKLFEALNDASTAASDLWDVVENSLKGALTWLTDKILTPLVTAFNDVRTAIAEVITEVLEFIETLTGIDLGPFSPGSPTPFELGIRGITSAVRELSNLALPPLEVQLAALGTPLLAGGGTVTAPAAVSSVTAGATISYGGNSVVIQNVEITGEMSMAQFEARLVRALRR